MRLPDLRYWIGAVAVSSGTLLIILAYRLHATKEEDIDIALLTGCAVMLLEICITYMILEQLLAARDQRRWEYARTAIVRMVDTCFVDTMRLIYVTTTETADADRRRFAEFVTLSDNHLKDLRSYIEGFSPLLDDETHSGSRIIEAQLRWMSQSLTERAAVQRLHDNNEIAVAYFRGMLKISRLVSTLMSLRKAGMFTEETHIIGKICESVVRERPLNLERLADRKAFMDMRFDCQTSLNSRTSALSAAERIRSQGMMPEPTSVGTCWRAVLGECPP
jgi:hypothetical protein